MNRIEELKRERLNVLFEEVFEPAYNKIGSWKGVCDFVGVSHSSLDEWRCGLPSNHLHYLSKEGRKGQRFSFPSQGLYQKIMLKKDEIFAKVFSEQAIGELGQKNDSLPVSLQEVSESKDVAAPKEPGGQIIFPLETGLEVLLLVIKPLLREENAEVRKQMREQFPNKIMELQLSGLALTSEEARKVVLKNNPELLDE